MAFSFCKANDMELASLEDVSAFANFFSLITTHIRQFDTPKAFIGAMAAKLKSSSEWYWISRGRGWRTNFPMPWNTGEPNDMLGDEYCLQVSEKDGIFGLNDSNCYNYLNQIHFICQEIVY